MFLRPRIAAPEKRNEDGDGARLRDQNAIVEEGGIAALVEAIEDGSVKGKEFAVLTLLQLCVDSVINRGFLVREGGIPPLVALSQTGSARAKHKVSHTLIKPLFDHTNKPHIIIFSNRQMLMVSFC